MYMYISKYEYMHSQVWVSEELVHEEWGSERTFLSGCLKNAANIHELFFFKINEMNVLTAHAHQPCVQHMENFTY
jgi:hypothetical protein